MTALFICYIGSGTRQHFVYSLSPVGLLTPTLIMWPVKFYRLILINKIRTGYAKADGIFSRTCRLNTGRNREQE